MPIWWMWVNAGFLRISDALVLRAMVSDPRHSDALVFEGGGFPMHCCMGFRMLRVSDSRHSDALVCGGFVIFAGNNEFVI